MRWGLLALLVAACRFEGGSGAVETGDASVTLVDADLTVMIDAPVEMPPPPPFSVLHVGSAAPGTGALAFDTAHVIDTDARTIDGAAPPSGVKLEHGTQSPSGPALALLRVGSLTVSASASVRVVGTRPLVVIANSAITISGTLDASARASTPGAGGFAPGAGPAPGADGTHDDTYLDGGGGGGGHVTAAGNGGDATGSGNTAQGGSGGAAVGDAAITMLRGGSGGGTGLGGVNGTPTYCRRPAGAGGGAIQLSSAWTISIAGRVLAGGGGGSGGLGTDGINCLNRGSGSGGGAGGAVVLQAPSITVAAGAVVAATGGGGGGGATVNINGGDGGNGGTSPGTFGTSPGGYGAAGGTGGGSTPPTPGADHTSGDGNGGGGGGAAGRIAIFRTATGMATIDGACVPAPHFGTY